LRSHKHRRERAQKQNRQQEWRAERPQNKKILFHIACFVDRTEKGVPTEAAAIKSPFGKSKAGSATVRATRLKTQGVIRALSR
jgi:hypothetical protein